MSRLRSSFLLLASALLAAASLRAAPPLPNIIFILADDLDYMDTNRCAEHLIGVPANRQ